MLYPRFLVPCLTAGALGAAACNLTPADTTVDPSDTDSTSEGSSEGTDSTTSTTSTTGDPTGTSEDPTTTATSTTTTTTSTTDTTDGMTTGPGLDDVTIYQIQGGEIAEGSIVTVKGVVISSPIQVEDGIMFVQEPDGGELSGIAVYLFDEVVMALDAKPGMIVDITGEYTEFFGESQLKVTAATDVVVTGEGDPPAPELVPAAADIATGGAKAEAYEGVLVEVQNVTVTNPMIDIGEFEVESSLRISDFFLFPLMMSPVVAQDQLFESIVGPLRYSFDNNKVAPRTPADLVTQEMPGGEVTIYDIQQGNVPLQSPVIVKGVVVTSPLTFKKDGFFVQDPMGGEFSGIYVYVGVNMVAVQPGDIVDLEGTYDEFFDFSQIKIADPTKVMITGNGPVPEPELVVEADVAAGGPLQENYEGVLVKVENVQVAAVNAQFGEYELTDGLFVDDLFFAKADWMMPKVADTFMSLTGPLAFSFMEAKLSPRTAADIVP